MKKEKKSLKGFYAKTFLIGLGFFTMGLMDPLYDTYVPIFLGRFLDKQSIIGTIMSLDNILAIFLIPLVSALSDKTRTVIGRRMPYIIVLLPLTAICFSFLPLASYTSLFLLIMLIFFLNIFKQSARGPVVALMPDTIPADVRSEANGVINTMGGIAAIVGTLFLARLMNVKVNFHGRILDGILPFPLSGALVILSTILVFIFIKENKEYTSVDSKENVKIKDSLSYIFKSKDKSVILILFSLLFWFIGYQGILPWVGKYSIEVLHTNKGNAALSAGMVGIAYAIFAVPSGIIAHKIGRKKTIRISLMGIVVIMGLLLVHSIFIDSFSSLQKAIIFWILLFIFGIFWVSIITNSFPMLWQMSSSSTIGIYTGLYYFFSQLASIIAPPLTGTSIDLFGYKSIFIFCLVSMFIAFILMGRVDQGEAKN